MFGFCSLKPLRGIWKNMGTVVGVTIVSMVFIGAVCGGCKKKSVVPVAPEKPVETATESVYTNRMHDATYREEIKQNLKEQRAKAKERSVVVDHMTELITQARAKLPAGADDAAVKAELEKSPEWRELEAQNQRLIGDIDATLARAREMVRQRMLQEAKDVQAVAEGRAKAADVPAPAK